MLNVLHGEVRTTELKYSVIEEMLLKRTFHHDEQTFGSEVIHEVSVDALSELVQAPGALFERTRVVRDFATVVTGSDTTGTDLEDISERLENFGPLDWGLQEIQSLVD